MRRLTLALFATVVFASTYPAKAGDYFGPSAARGANSDITSLSALVSASINAFIVNGSSHAVVSYSQLSGTLATGNNFAANYDEITSDTLNYGGSNYASTLHLDHNFGGAAMRGNRANLDLSMIMQGTTGNTGNATQEYVGFADYVSCSYNDNGSAGFANAAGDCVGANPIVQMGAGATYWYIANPQELDLFTSAGASAAHAFGQLLVKSGPLIGTYDDAAIDFDGSTSAAWTNILQLGKTDGASPTNSSSTILACVENSTTLTPCSINNGIDLRNFTIAGDAFASPGLVIDGSGNLTATSISATTFNGPSAGVASVTVTTGGSYSFVPSVSLGAPPSGVQAVALVTGMGLSQANLQSGGTSYVVNGILSLTGNGTCSVAPQVQITAVTGGVIQSYVGYNAGVCSVLPTNPVTATGGSGSGATFNPNWYPDVVAVTNAGSGYVSAPSVTFSTSGGGTAVGYSTLGSVSPITYNAAAGVNFTGLTSSLSGTATVAGGQCAYAMGSDGIKICWGTGAPTISAPEGSTYQRKDASSSSTRFYINTNGSTSWTSVTTAN